MVETGRARGRVHEDAQARSEAAMGMSTVDDNFNRVSILRDLGMRCRKGDWVAEENSNFECRWEACCFS